MGKFLDPIENAKSIGFLLILAGVINLLTFFPRLMDPTTYQQPILTILGLIIPIGYFIVGLGLRRTNLWALHVFLVLTGLSVFGFLYYLARGGSYVIGKAVGPAINVLLSLWFYSARARFQTKA